MNPIGVDVLTPIDAPTLGVDQPVDGTPGDFQALAARVRAAGLLDRRPLYYWLKVLLTIGAFGAGWAAFAIVGNSGRSSWSHCSWV